MKRVFVKKEQLSLQNGGYLMASNGTEGAIPVFNQDFIAVQKHAEWVVTFAEKAKGKDFIGKWPDKIEDVKREVKEALSNKGVKYVKEPKEVKRDLTSKLQAEALSFIQFHGETNKVNRINEFLQQFNILSEYEEFGLYFEEQVCKLNKIYSIEEVVKAVTEVIDLVD
jgi:DNA mismatch repair ATPase MutL